MSALLTTGETMAIIQGALGRSGASGAGTLGITVDRSNLQVAPDSVRFAPDLSATTFDTAARWIHPGGAIGANAGSPGDLAHPDFDNRLHDILYFWDSGETRAYQYTNHVLDHWKDARYGTGPTFVHCYASPGTYTAKLIAYEPSSGKVAEATTEIVVGNADTAYPTTQTICVYPTGDTAGDGVPEGATTVDISGFTALYQALPDTNQLRILLKRGTTIDGLNFRVWPDRSGETGAPNMFFGAYGTGAKPIVQGVFRAIDVREYAGTQDVRITGIDFNGEFDIDNPTTVDWGTDTDGSKPAGVGSVAVTTDGTEKNIRLLFHDCTVRQWWGGDGAGIFSGETAYVHFDDCNLNNFRGKYVILIGAMTGATTPASTFAFTGNSAVASVNMPIDQDFTESIFRLGSYEYNYIAGNDFFSTGTTNALIKVENSPEETLLLDFSGDAAQVEASDVWLHGRVTNIHSNTFEGQATTITNARTAKYGGGAQNFVVDGNIFIAGPKTTEFIETGGQGLTIRNNYFWAPGAPTLSGGALNHFIEIDRFTYNQTTYAITDTLAATGQPYTWYGRPFPGMAPIRVYNNTFVCDRSTAENGGGVPDLYSFGIQVLGGSVDENLNGAENYTLFEAVFFENNILHLPNMGTTVAGLDSSTNLPFAPYFRGPAYWNNTTKTYTAIVPGNAQEHYLLSIPTYAATTGGPLTGTENTRVNGARLPLDVEWSPTNPAGSVEPGTGPEGAWSQDATPT